MTRLVDFAYIRDGKLTHTGESLLIAALLKVKGSPLRPKRQLEEVGRVMKDQNLDK